MVMTMTERPSTQQEDRKGKPVQGRFEMEGLARIRCWNCNRIIATGSLPTLPEGKVLVIQCGHKECRAYNKFNGE